MAEHCSGRQPYSETVRDNRGTGHRIGIATD